MGDRSLYRSFIFSLFVLFILVPFEGLRARNDGGRYAPVSVLSEGLWYKVSIPQTGVYKLTYDDLKKMGLKNPANVQVFGYGGWVLDEDFRKSYVDDLPRVPVWMSSTPDSFGEDDYILFYGRGDIKWEFNTLLKEFEHKQHFYSSDSYYFVTESSDGPFLIGSVASKGGATEVVSSYDDYFLHEKELVNLNESGRDFFGEDFKPLSARKQTFSIPLQGATADEATIRYSFVAKEPLTTGVLEVSLNGNVIKRNNLLANNQYEVLAAIVRDSVKTTALQNYNSLTLSYNSPLNSNLRLAHLDYIRINYKRRLKAYGAVTLFRNKIVSSNLGFRVEGVTPTTEVWDVSDNSRIFKVNGVFEGSVFNFSADNSKIREYALVDVSDRANIPNATLVGQVNNQNLHASQVADMIIIAQPLLRSSAERLAKLHEMKSGLRSLVVDPNEIYNEFSSGKPDATAYRRFLKMFYDRASEGGARPQYLLLFGDGTFDNRSVGVADDGTDGMLLTYQSGVSPTVNFIRRINLFVTDDYFGLLDDSEGVNLAKDNLDLGIGRIPVNTELEAERVVDKIEAYMVDGNKGIWQNNVTFVADDLIGSLVSTVQSEKTHIRAAEFLSTYIEERYPDIVVNKVYEDAYERLIEANGGRYPDAKRVLLDRINNGTLVLNFIGHGTARSWTHEYLLDLDDINGLNNNKLPLWITATCDFSSFDAREKSAGEIALLKENGGAIALLSTVREVYIVSNDVINEKLASYLFEKKDGFPLRLGDIIRRAKLDLTSDDDKANSLRFLLLGDPALRLAYPTDKYEIEVTEINGVDASASGINIGALQEVSVKGRIVDDKGKAVFDFNGIVETTMFDALQELVTRGNRRNGTPDPENAFAYTQYTNTLFSGRVRVENGVFTINFTTPKDILYSGNQGKMTFLAYDDDGLNKASGSFYNYTVGGSNPTVEEDVTPPDVSAIYLNDSQFKNGDRVSSSAIFYAEVSDDSGINLSSGIGHNILLVLDDQFEYDLTPYFSNSDTSTRAGVVRFPLPVLDLGNHTITFRVWDVWNNSTYEMIDFVVSNDNTPAAYAFEIWGNPAKDFTTFVFTTDMPDDDATIKLSIYSLPGRMVWNYEGRGEADLMSRVSKDWDLTGNDGGRLNPGVYICVGEITSGGKTWSRKSLKLMIVNN